MLICHICNERADFQLEFDCINCTDHLYFCKKHKPSDFKVFEFDNKQNKYSSNTSNK